MERTTQYLIETLGSDIDRCHACLIDEIDQGEVDADGGVYADYEYHARHLIRLILAYIEAVTVSVKVSSVNRCLDSGIDVSDYQRYLAIEISSTLNDKGEIVAHPAKTRLPANVRFAFRLLEKATGRASRFDPSDKWWSCLQATIRVRDRLTHPRMPKDIDVSGSEIVSALEARKGFDEVLLPTVDEIDPRN